MSDISDILRRWSQGQVKFGLRQYFTYTLFEMHFIWFAVWSHRHWGKRWGHLGWQLSSVCSQRARAHLPDTAHTSGYITSVYTNSEGRERSHSPLDVRSALWTGRKRRATLLRVLLVTLTLVVENKKLYFDLDVCIVSTCSVLSFHSFYKRPKFPIVLEKYLWALKTNFHNISFCPFSFLRCSVNAALGLLSCRRFLFNFITFVPSTGPKQSCSCCFCFLAFNFTVLVYCSKPLAYSHSHFAQEGPRKQAREHAARCLIGGKEVAGVVRKVANSRKRAKLGSVISTKQIKEDYSRVKTVLYFVCFTKQVFSFKRTKSSAEPTFCHVI